MYARGIATRKRIREAACKLFAQKGFKSVTMKDINTAAGISRGGLYRHYSSTKEIFDEILTEQYVIEDKIEQKVPATEILEAMLVKLEEEMIDSKTSLSLAVYEYANMGNEEIFIKANQKSIDRWVKLIHYGMETGEFHQVKAEQIADVILYSYQGVRMWSRVIPLGEVTAKHMVDTVRELLVK